MACIAKVLIYTQHLAQQSITQTACISKALMHTQQLAPGVHSTVENAFCVMVVFSSLV